MKPKSFVPKGAESFAFDFDGPPKDVHFLLLPKLTMLALSAAIEPMRVANQVTGKELYRWFLISETGGAERCSNGIDIIADQALTQLPRSSRIFVCSGTEPTETTSATVLDWLRRQRAFGCKLGGICSGAFALARTGALTGRRFTLHWENQPAFIEHFPELEPSSNLYVIDGDLMTCGGGSAATDMMLDMIQSDHGLDLALIVSDMCIHARANNRDARQKSSLSVALGSRNPHLIQAIQIMHENIEDPLDILDIADQVDISRRQLERLFKKYVEVSPVHFYMDLRVSRAHALLNETEMPVGEIAVATGFSSATQLAVRFKRRFGTSPSAFRRVWSG